VINRFKNLRPFPKTVVVIALLTLIVMAVSLWLFPEWRTTPAWLLMLFLAALLGVTTFLDNFSGALSLFKRQAPEHPSETDVTVQVLIQQTTHTILEQLDRRRLSISPEALQQATSSYLTYLVDRYQILDFKGMGSIASSPCRCWRCTCR